MQNVFKSKKKKPTLTLQGTHSMGSMNLLSYQLELIPWDAVGWRRNQCHGNLRLLCGEHSDVRQTAGTGHIAISYGGCRRGANWPWGCGELHWLLMLLYQIHHHQDAVRALLLPGAEGKPHPCLFQLLEAA